MERKFMFCISLLTLTVAACGADETGVTATTTLSIIENSAEKPQPTPTPTPSASGTHHHKSSLLPHIDISKIPVAAGGFDTARIRPETRDVPKQNTDGTGQFRFTCEYSHMSFNDPIVFPGQSNMTHLHVFFGNTGINHASTQETIEKTGNSTCAGGIVNRTGYWVPAIIDTKDGTPLKPSKILIYYKSDDVGSANVKPYPAGLRMISGDMTSSGPQRRAGYGCLGPNGEEQRFSAIPPDCPVGWTLEMSIAFPMCWDGVNLDSADHKSHMAFTVWDNAVRKVVCPASHPVALPGLTEKISYKVLETGSTSRWRLSSDNYEKNLPGGYSVHADWFNGWDPVVQEIWIKNCLQASRDCHGFLLGDGTTLF